MISRDVIHKYRIMEIMKLIGLTEGIITNINSIELSSLLSESKIEVKEEETGNVSCILFAYSVKYIINLIL